VGAVKNARRLTAVNDAAARAGLRVGMSFADASAIYPALAWAEAAPAEDARLLTGIAEWCERYTPLVGLDPPDGLIFDITGVSHLFGGEAALARDLMRRLASQGFHARIGIADTVGGASAVARYGKTAIIPPGKIPDALAPLPVGALRIDGETRLGLIQLGLKTIGALMGRPRAPLSARFGEALLQRLDQALGREEEPITPRLPVPALCVEQGFPEPLMRDEDLLAVLAHLEQQLCGLLEQRGQGARHLLATFFGAGGGVNRIEIGTSRVLRDVSHLHRLFTDKFEQAHWDNEFGYDRIRLAVLEAESFSASQKDLTAAEDGPELAQLIDRLSARLGVTRVLRIMPQDTHVPEHASVTIPAAHAKEFAPPTPPVQDGLAPSRPIRLFERPEPIDAMAEFPDGPPVRFRWRRVLHQVVRVEGPERIALPWWRDAEKRALTRDYFRVETGEGARLWLFRDGLYSETAVAPRWFCHGFLP
jgi:protein ImuB